MWNESAAVADYFATQLPMNVFQEQNDGWNQNQTDVKTMDAVPSHSLNDVEKASLAKQLHALFDHWQVPPVQRLALMGIAEKSKSERVDWEPYLTGEGRDRAAYLLSIHALLRTLFPANSELAYSWMQTPNSAFTGATPVAVIVESGMTGLLSVHAYLNAALER